MISTRLNNLPSTNGTFKPFEINNTGKISGLQAENISKALDDIGFTIKNGDNAILKIAGNEVIDVLPYSDDLYHEVSSLKDGSVAKVVKAENVGYDSGKTIYREVKDGFHGQAFTKVDNQESAAAQAGIEGVGGEYSLFNKPLESIIEPATIQIENVTIKRPSWRQSELDAANDFPGFGSQKSFIRMDDGSIHEVPYGTKGSVRPDYSTSMHSVDIKNYNVTSPKGRSNLIRNIVKQYNKRIVNLPLETKQIVMIDIRGQSVSEDALRLLYNEIMNRVNDSIEIFFKVK